jgi:hypothetical protein
MTSSWFIVRNPLLQSPKRSASSPAAARRAKAARPPFQGAGLWDAWHRRALSWTGGDDTPWVNSQILQKLPCGECSNHARAWLKENPPTFTAELYFAWTVAFHNGVNHRLGRPIWSVGEARSYWALRPGLDALQEA